MRFSAAEFDLMLYELLEADPPMFDTLCSIVEKELMPSIRGWCANDPALRGRYCEDEILNDTQHKIIITCITSFFLREGRTEPNRDMEQFCRWIYTIAHNTARDCASKYRECIIVDYDELQERITDDEAEEYLTEDIAAIFDLAMSFKNVIYKLLAWLCVAVIILKEADKRSVATEILVDRFANASLDSMLDFLISELRDYPELMLDASQEKKMRQALDEKDEEGVRIGDRPFSHFFMSKGGKYSVSDWIHRINHSIKENFVW